MPGFEVDAVAGEGQCFRNTAASESQHTAEHVDLEGTVTRGVNKGVHLRRGEIFPLALTIENRPANLV